MASVNSSELRFYMELVLRLLRQPTYPRPNRGSVERDAETFVARAELEGIGFLTKTLPRLGKWLLESIEVGNIVGPPPGFRQLRDCALPAFMQDALMRLFDVDGRLLDEACPQALAYAEQVLFACYKLELPYAKAEEERVVGGFVATERELAECTIPRDELLYVAGSIVKQVVGGFNPDHFKPRHGPGAVATGEKAERKWYFDTVYAQLEKFYPYFTHFTTCGAGVDKEFWPEKAPRKAALNGHAKVVLVPKDSRGPRLISCEPLAYQWVQQGIAEQVVDLISRHKLTAGHVNFTDQTVNGRWALESSLTRALATLDLKDASDRVSLELVRALFPRVLLERLEASRSVATELPSGELLPLVKFAPMGSALCFPVLSLVVWSLAVASISLRRGKTLQEGKTGVYVFGDDLIVPSDEAQSVMDDLERYGLRVNRAKSFIRSNYRESCGVDAFKGVVVTPTRVKRRWTGRRSDGSALASYAEVANALTRKGYTDAASFLWESLDRTYGFIPYAPAGSGFPAKECDSWVISRFLNEVNGVKHRWNRAYQHWEMRVVRLTTDSRKPEFSGWPRLLRSLVQPVVDADPDEVVLPRSTRMKRGWAPCWA